MSDVIKAALGSATIVAVGLYLAAYRLAPARYKVVTSGNGGVAWKIDRRTGELFFCASNTGCQAVKVAARTSAQPGDWLDTWKQNQPANSN